MVYNITFLRFIPKHPPILFAGLFGMNPIPDTQIIRNITDTDTDTDTDILNALFDDDEDDLADERRSTTALRPSYEQQLAINHLLDGHNVVLDSVSGSGKSTTILSCVEQLSDKSVLQLTYNAMLRKEVREKVHARNLHNICVHTFHSLAVYHYHKDAHKDIVLRKILQTNMRPVRPIPRYDLVFLDESQDMSLLYYAIMVKFLTDMGNPFQICILGDYKQGIYQFRGSDIRFLTKAAQIWRPFPLLSSPVFHHCSLTMSYRITNQMADFVNDVMLGEKRLMACKSGPKIHYIRNSKSNIIRIICFHILRLLREGQSPSTIFVLSASVKNGYVRKIENALVERGIPCYVPLSDGDQIDERIITGKVVFSTFHSVKGRERKHVFVLGFDNSYFQYYAPELPITECPNTLYVACTRATESLFVCELNQFAGDRPLAFLQKTHYEMKESAYIEFNGIPQRIFDTADDAYDRDQKDRFHDVSPTTLIRFISESVVEEITPVLERAFHIEQEPHPELEIEIPILIQTTRGFHEDVSDLNGIAIPSIYYDHLYRRVFAAEGSAPDAETETLPIGARILLNNIESFMCETKDGEYTYLKEKIASLPKTIATPEEYLYLANIYVSVKERLYYRMFQIGEADYGWLSDSVIRECLCRFDEIIGGECQPNTDVRIEYSLIDSTKEEENARVNAVLAPFFESDPRKFRFSARTDLITPDNVWEIKCTTAVSMEHQLQVIIYAWLWRIIYPELPRDFRILNIRSGEIQRLELSLEDMTFVVVALLRGKYDRPAEKTDEEFMCDVWGRSPPTTPRVSE
jgi:hypothetical protein